MNQHQDSRQVFRLEGEFWTIAFDDVVTRLRDSKGMRLLAILLAHPGVRLPATALSGAVDSNRQIELGTEETEGLPRRSAVEDAARVKVRRAVWAAMRRIDEHHPSAGLHLKTTIRTGSFCSYTPDSRLPITWEGTEFAKTGELAELATSTSAGPGGARGLAR